MCTLAVYTRVSAELPLVVAANRDEYLDRPTAPPRLLSTGPWVLAGQDLEAGGTWLGLNQAGVVVGLLNRRSSQGPDATKASRGILCLRALQQGSLEEIRGLLGSEVGDAYNPFTLVAMSAVGAFVATPQGSRIDIVDLEPGIHVVTNQELNDATCPRIQRARPELEALRLEDSRDDRLSSLRRILSSHTTQSEPRSIESEDGLCIHFGPYGTRSSSIVEIEQGGAPRYWHAEGPPCRTTYEQLETPAATPSE